MQIHLHHESYPPPHQPSRKQLNTCDFYCYNLTTNIDDYNFVNNKKEHTLIVNCLNPHSFITAEHDPEFKQSLQQSDILLPDGVGICMVMHRFAGIRIKKIAGDDFHQQLLQQLNDTGGRVFYLGSTEATLAGIRRRIATEYSNISIKTFSPPYQERFSDEVNQQIIDLINDFHPDAVLVGLTAPKQEKWIYRHRRQLRHDIKVVAAIGGAFDFFAGTIKRAPQWVINLYCEWLYRFLREPIRMWQRNIVSTPKFLFYTYHHRGAIQGGDN